MTPSFVFTALIVASSLFFFAVLLLVVMRIYVGIRRTMLDKRIETYLNKYEMTGIREGRVLSLPPLSTASTTMEVEEPPGDVALELDLTREN